MRTGMTARMFLTEMAVMPPGHGVVLVCQIRERPYPAQGRCLHAGWHVVRATPDLQTRKARAIFRLELGKPQYVCSRAGGSIGLKSACRRTRQWAAGN